MSKFPHDDTTIALHVAAELSEKIGEMRTALRLAERAIAQCEVADAEDALQIVADGLEQIGEKIDGMTVNRPTARSIRSFDELKKIYG